MPPRESLTHTHPGEVAVDPCELAARWTVDLDVMRRVVAAAIQFRAETGRDVLIISGYRSQKDQDQLRQEGRPAADELRSTHRSCPATGVDVHIGYGVVNAMKATWGRIVTENGLRWGGGSRPDPATGIPSDWNHVDAGRRQG